GVARVSVGVTDGGAKLRRPVDAIRRRGLAGLEGFRIGSRDAVDPVGRSTMAWRIAVVVQRTGEEFEWTVVGTGEAHLATDHAAEPDTRGKDGVGVSILRYRIDVT